jgi:hypothetical protein
VRPFHRTGGKAGDSGQFESLLDAGPDITPRAALIDKGCDDCSRPRDLVVSDGVRQAFIHFRLPVRFGNVLGVKFAIARLQVLVIQVVPIASPSGRHQKRYSGQRGQKPAPHDFPSARKKINARRHQITFFARESNQAGVAAPQPTAARRDRLARLSIVAGPCRGIR